ncbi:MAG: hypothetical protein HRF45_11265 [Fimbriimonadia bacterium]|jgi:hypothetical protein
MSMEAPSPQPSYAEDEILGALGRLWRAKWLILILAVLVGALTLLVTYLLPPVWKAKATVMLPLRSPSPLVMTPGMVDTSAVGNVLGGPSPLRMLAAMLESETVLQEVTKATGLTRKKLLDIRDVDDRETGNTITISIRHGDRELALKAVRAHLEALRKLTVQLNVPPVTSDAGTLQQALDEKSRELAEAEERLEKFQSSVATAPIVATPNQAGGTAVVLPAAWLNQLTDAQVELKRMNAVIDGHLQRIEKQSGKAVEFPTDIAAAKPWRDRLIGLEYELRMALVSSAPDSPHIKRIQEQIGITRAELGAQVTKYLQALRDDLLDPATDLKGEGLADSVASRVGLEARIEALRRLVDLAPKEAKEYQRLLRDVTTLGAIVQQLRTNLEIVRLQVERDPILWQVMDEPGIYDRPVNKRYVFYPALGALGGALLGCVIGLARTRR